MFGMKYIPRSALLNLIFEFRPNASIRLRTFTIIVEATANLKVNK